MSKLPTHRVRRRSSWFRPVPLRSRRDGWTEVRQCAFLAQLYAKGSLGRSMHNQLRRRSRLHLMDFQYLKEYDRSDHASWTTAAGNGMNSVGIALLLAG